MRIEHTLDVCEIVFNEPIPSGIESELWTFDFSTFEEFVDAVEQGDDFSALIVKTADESSVYWAEA
jgi:hypothetical protein